MKIKLHRPLEGTIKRLIIARDRLGNWYACFVVEVEPRVLPPAPHITGIDSTTRAFSDGTRKTWHGHSARWPPLEKEPLRVRPTVGALGEAKRKVQHIHQRIKHRRNDFAHQESRTLVNTYQGLVFEDLSVANMLKNHSLAKSISDAAWEQSPIMYNVSLR